MQRLSIQQEARRLCPSGSDHREGEGGNEEVERLRIEIIFHDGSKAVFERQPPKSWLYTEEVPDEATNENSKFLSKDEEVRVGSVMEMILDSFLIMSGSDPIGGKNY
jgi:hypothetical protein